jgi:hypothetical protein
MATCRYTPRRIRGGWSRPESFLLDEERNFTAVAGVPRIISALTGSFGETALRLGIVEEKGYALWMDRIAMAAVCLL